MDEKSIHIVAAAGSVQPGNFTSKALALVAEEVNHSDRARIDGVDLRDVNLPLPSQGDSADTKHLRDRFAAATGVVMTTPEYHGSYSSSMKFLIDNLGFPSVLSGKSISLLGVTAGQMGAIKALEHLRSVGSHVGGTVLPGPVSIAGAQKLFDEEGHCLDEGTNNRIRGVATNLLDYIEGNICPRVTLEEIARGNETGWMRRVCGTAM